MDNCSVDKLIGQVLCRLKNREKFLQYQAGNNTNTAHLVLQMSMGVIYHHYSSGLLDRLPPFLQKKTCCRIVPYLSCDHTNDKQRLIDDNIFLIQILNKQHAL